MPSTATADASPTTPSPVSVTDSGTVSASMSATAMQTIGRCTSYFGLGRLSHWIRPTSEQLSQAAEARLLSRHPGFQRDSHLDSRSLTDELGTARVEQVDIGNGEFINTLTLTGPTSESGRQSTDQQAPVMVLAHGYGAGLGYFYRSYPALARPGWRVHSIDWLGMGRSARVPFPTRRSDQTREEFSQIAESFFVESLERWRQQQGIDRMLLAGHSMGGYFSVAYALKYPQHVERLVLISPVGVPEQPNRAEKEGAVAETASDSTHPSELAAVSDDTLVAATLPSTSGISGKAAPTANVTEDLPTPQNEFGSAGRRRAVPRWMLSMWERNITPQWIVRASGPFGPRLVHTYIENRMAHLPPEERSDLEEYTYHITSAAGSGEYALSAILAPGAHAHRPLKDRLPQLTMPTTFIYGERDWMDYRHAVRAQPTMSVETEVIRIPNGGHHMYGENPDAFNDVVHAEMRKMEEASQASQ